MTISFDRVADQYDETRALPPEVAEQVTECIVQLSRAVPTTTFFEPGIGTGRIALPLVARGYAYTGVDISELMMDKLRQKLAGTDHRLTLVNADATSLPFADGSFDVAIASHILHLISDWHTALDEMYRVLKPEGVVIYFHHPRPKDFAYDQFDQQWQAILSGLGHQSTRLGAGTEEVLAYLTEQGNTPETVTVAQPVRVRTVGDVLNAYRDRIYSHLWIIPDEIFEPAITALTTWVDQTFPSPAATFESRSPLKITAAYKKA